MNRRARRATKKAAAAPASQVPASRQLHTASLADFRVAVRLMREQRWAESEAAHAKVHMKNPRHGPTVHHLGLIAFKLGQTDKSLRLLQNALDIEPDCHDARLHLAVVLKASGRADLAAKQCRMVVASDTHNATALVELGNCLKQLGQTSDAGQAYRRALVLSPDDTRTAEKIAQCALEARELEDCVKACRALLARTPDNVTARKILARALILAGGIDGSEVSDAIEASCASAAERIDLAVEIAMTRHADGHSAQALTELDQARRRHPSSARICIVQGRILKEIGDHQAAVAALEAGLDLDGADPVGYHVMGQVLFSLGALDGAVTALRRASELAPNSTDVLTTLGTVLHAIGRNTEALQALKSTCDLDPTNMAARTAYCSIRRYLCDWHGLDELERELVHDLRASTEPVAPFQLLGAPVSNSDMRVVGERYANRLKELAGIKASATSAAPLAKPGGRIRIGYLSSDFSHHATSMLIVELLERHDRRRFETFAYCHSPDDGSTLRQRVQSAFEHFNCVGQLSNRATADKIRSDGIEILIDLNGYTRGMRPAILALRPSPVQITYLGYPATTGADYIDYLIADPVVAPLEHHKDYSEKIVQLRTCYQPNDSKRKVKPTHWTRTDVGLPEHGFVFCSFNNNFKLNSTFFRVWMDLLHQVPGSVLWLLQKSPEVAAHLRGAAVSHGIDHSRLVFAQNVPNDQHLSRHALADLFLDSLPCSAHTTASEAVFAGLPLLTCLGENFAGRVAASVLTSCGLPQLIATSLEDYRATALRLARNPREIADLKAHLRDRRSAMPLFDTAAYAREFEGALSHISHRIRSGLPPQSFAVSDADCAVSDDGTLSDFEAPISDSKTVAMECATAMLAQIEACRASGRNVEAARLCGELLMREPANHAPYLHLAELAELTGAKQKAANFLTEAILLEPGCGTAHIQLYKLQKAMGQLRPAAKSLSTAITLGSALPEHPLELANLLYEIGDTSAAIVGYRDALSRNPSCGMSQAMLKLLAASEPAPEPAQATVTVATDELPPQWRNVNLCIIAPPGNGHWQAFSDIATGFAYALAELGADSTVTLNEIQSDAQNIVFGAHLIPTLEMARSISPETVLFNLEQIDGIGLQRYPVYHTLLSQLPVWDYSSRNIARIRELLGNSNIHLARVGYSASLERIGRSSHHATDVLFYGSLNERRIAILNQLTSAGLNVRHLFNVYGEARDDAIRQAKVVLNMHFYPDSIHEVVRTSLLLANRKAVVCECNAGTEIDDDLRPAMRAVPYEHLATACMTLVRDEAARLALESSAYEIFRSRKQSEFLRQVISACASRR